METATLITHITAGSVAILAGYVAIFAAKGASVHRRSGRLFVYAMIVMGTTGLAISIIRHIPGSLAGGPLAAYLVITGVTAVRPVDRRFDLALLIIPLSTGTMCLALVANAMTNGRATVSGVPIPMILFLGVVAFLSALSDIRLLRGAVSLGANRITRHLWRMCFAFWIATGSFFLGQMDEFPARLQQPALMAIPAMLPLLLMVYWVWRVRFRRALAGLVLRRA